MKTFALAALLLAAACSKKTADCEASISKGVDDLTATVTARAVNPQMKERMATALGKLKGTLIKRCTDDKWAPDAIPCFANIPSMKGLQDCEAKLTDEQRKHVESERRSLMRGGGGGGPRMPDIPGHPQNLTPTDPNAAAPASPDSPSPSPGTPASPPPPPASPPATPASPSGSAATPPPAPSAPPAGSAK